MKRIIKIYFIHWLNIDVFFSFFKLRNLKIISHLIKTWGTIKVFFYSMTNFDVTEVYRIKKAGCCIFAYVMVWTQFSTNDMGWPNLNIQILLWVNCHWKEAIFKKFFWKINWCILRFYSTVCIRFWVCSIFCKTKCNSGTIKFNLVLLKFM